jgi:hypothetical protein
VGGDEASSMPTRTTQNDTMRRRSQLVVNKKKLGVNYHAFVPESLFVMRLKIVVAINTFVFFRTKVCFIWASSECVLC